MKGLATDVAFPEVAVAREGIKMAKEVTQIPAVKVVGKVILVTAIAGTGYVIFTIVSGSMAKSKVEKMALNGNDAAESALALASILDKPGLLAWLGNLARGAEEILKDITMASLFLPKDEKRNTPYEKLRYIAAQIKSKNVSGAEVSKNYKKYTGNSLADDIKKNLKAKEREEFYGIIQGTVDYTIEDAKSETDLPSPDDYSTSVFSAAAKGEFVCMKKNAPIFNDSLFENTMWTMTTKTFSAQDSLPVEARIATPFYKPNSADEIKKGVPLGIFTGTIKKYDSYGTSNPDMLQIKRGSKFFWVEAGNVVRFKSKELAKNFAKGSYTNAEADLMALNGSQLFGLTLFGLT